MGFSCTKWLLTINNPLDYGFDHNKIIELLHSLKNITYYCLCDEIGHSGTFHTHIFIYKYRVAIDFTTIKNLFPQAHIDKCNGTCEENRNYLLKGGSEKNESKADTSVPGSFYESGECPSNDGQGKRNDIYSMYDMITSGASDYDIINSNPTLIKHIDKFDKVRQVLREKEFAQKIRDMHVEYWYGPPGTGKTSAVYCKYGFENVYTVDDYRHPFDNYSSQDVILFDEFQIGNYDILQILRWLDIYPLKLSCRYTNKQACYTKVIFTSNYSFEDMFRMIRINNPDTYQALCRRFHGFRHYTKLGKYEEYDKPNSGSRWMEINDNEASEIEEMFGSFKQERIPGTLPNIRS